MIEVISSYNICSGIYSKQAKKPFVTQYQKLLIFFQNSSVSFHQVTFDHSISCALVIDKPYWKLQKLKNIWKKHLIHRKKLLERKENNITLATTNASISQTSSECLKLTIQTYGMRNKKNLKWSLDNFKRKYQKHLCQLVLI